MNSKIFLLSILIATPAFGMDYIKNLLGYTADSYQHDDHLAHGVTNRLNDHIEDNIVIIETAEQTKLRLQEEKFLKAKEELDKKYELQKQQREERLRQEKERLQKQIDEINKKIEEEGAPF